MHSRLKGSTTVEVMIEDISLATKGRHMRWVMVDEIAQRLRLDQDAIDAAIRLAEANGLLIAEGTPVHSVCLTDEGRQLLDRISSTARCWAGS